MEMYIDHLKKYKEGNFDTTRFGIPWGLCEEGRNSGNGIHGPDLAAGVPRAPFR